jgi:hypothetical protein
MAKKMFFPAKIIVFQKLRLFFTFSGQKSPYKYRIIVHLATLPSTVARISSVGGLWGGCSFVAF